MAEELLKFEDEVFKELCSICERLMKKGVKEKLRASDAVLGMTYGLLSATVALHRAAEVSDAEGKVVIKNILNNLYGSDTKEP